MVGESDKEQGRERREGSWEKAGQRAAWVRVPTGKGEVGGQWWEEDRLEGDPNRLRRLRDEASGVGGPPCCDTAWSHQVVFILCYFSLFLSKRK